MAVRKRSDLATRGERVRRRIHGDTHVERNYREADDFMWMWQDVTDEFCWGTVWARPALGPKVRAALSLAMTSAQSQAGAVKMHVKTCLRQGWTEREVGEILLHTYVYAGVYASLSSFTVAREAIAEYREEVRQEKRKAKAEGGGKAGARKAPARRRSRD